MADLTHNEFLVPIAGPDGNGKYESVSVPGAKANVDKIPGIETQLLTYPEVERKTFTPSIYSSYLLDGDDYQTDGLLAGVPTRLLIPTTIKFNTDWMITEVNPSQFAVQYVGSSTRRFSINVTSGMQAQTNNTIVHLDVRKGIAGDSGASVTEPGVSIVRKVGTGSDTGAIGLSGIFDIEPLGYIEVWATSSLASYLIFIETSINILEVN